MSGDVVLLPMSVELADQIREWSVPVRCLLFGPVFIWWPEGDFHTKITDAGRFEGKRQIRARVGPCPPASDPRNKNYATRPDQVKHE